MLKLLKIAAFLSITALILSCGSSNNNIQKNLAELDKIYGPCNNPYRQYSPNQKRICEDKVRAAGPDGEIGEPLNITEMLDDLRNGGGTTIVASSVNKDLWNGSLSMLDKYAIKNLDYEGGFIETEWIYDENIKDQRCAIKVNVISPELVSNGVNVTINCEKRIDDQWYILSEEYLNEEKKLTLQILQIAKENSLNTQLS